MKHAIILLAILALALGASAQQTAAPEPYSVKSDKLGETSAEWLASDPNHKNWTCEDGSHTAEGKPFTCFWESGYIPGKITLVTYAGMELLKQSASFVAKDGKLVVYKVELTFCNGDGYEATLISALDEKFGTASHKVTLLQNGFGATSNEDTWTWSNGISTVTLDYILPEPIYHSPVVTFTLDALAREIQVRQDKAAQRKARSDM
jgi:hypothetical protein